MKKFEYKTVVEKYYLLTTTLNKLGKKGWELITVTIRENNDSVAYFKKEI